MDKDRLLENRKGEVVNVFLGMVKKNFSGISSGRRGLQVGCNLYFLRMEATETDGEKSCVSRQKVKYFSERTLRITNI